MSKVITFSELDRIRKATAGPSAIYESIEASIQRMAANRSHGVRTFLSHSSKDIAYLPSIIKILQDHGAKVYYDIEDHRMPKPPNKVTAKILKIEIAASNRFVLFVTDNSYNSKWVPWELGLGDALIQPRNIALFPASNNPDTTWVKTEYLELYCRIVRGNIPGTIGEQWIVRDDEEKRTYKLSDWISG